MQPVYFVQQIREHYKGILPTHNGSGMELFYDTKSGFFLLFQYIFVIKTVFHTHGVSFLFDYCNVWSSELISTV